MEKYCRVCGNPSSADYGPRPQIYRKMSRTHWQSGDLVTKISPPNCISGVLLLEYFELLNLYWIDKLETSCFHHTQTNRAILLKDVLQSKISLLMITLRVMCL